MVETFPVGWSCGDCPDWGCVVRQSVCVGVSGELGIVSMYVVDLVPGGDLLSAVTCAACVTVTGTGVSEGERGLCVFLGCAVKNGPGSAGGVGNVLCRVVGWLSR
jgi:hypothetical protein